MARITVRDFCILNLEHVLQIVYYELSTHEFIKIKIHTDIYFFLFIEKKEWYSLFLCIKKGKQIRLVVKKIPLKLAWHSAWPQLSAKCIHQILVKYEKNLKGDEGFFFMIFHFRNPDI